MTYFSEMQKYFSFLPQNLSKSSANPLMYGSYSIVWYMFSIIQYNKINDYPPTLLFGNRYGYELAHLMICSLPTLLSAHFRSNLLLLNLTLKLNSFFVLSDCI